MGKEGYTINT